MYFGASSSLDSYYPANVKDFIFDLYLILKINKINNIFFQYLLLFIIILLNLILFENL